MLVLTIPLLLEFSTHVRTFGVFLVVSSAKNEAKNWQIQSK